MFAHTRNENAQQKINVCICQVSILSITSVTFYADSLKTGRKANSRGKKLMGYGPNYGSKLLAGYLYMYYALAST